MEGQLSWGDRSHGRDRWLKRSPSTSNGAATKSGSKNARRSLSRVYVEIPEYYRTAPSRTSDFAITDDKKNAGGVDGGRDGLDDPPRIINKVAEGAMSSGENSRVHRHSELKYPPEGAFNEQTKGGKHGVVLFDKKYLSREHPKSAWHLKFTSALERHGSSPGAWKDMASELNSTERDVKVYAYSYFKALVQDKDEKSRAGLLLMNGYQSRGGRNSAINDDTAWSFQELVLLDSLLLKFCTDLTCLSEIDGDCNTDQRCPSLLRQTTVWEKIASQLPGKTARECKKEGISRLLTICNVQQNAKKTGGGAAVISAPS